MAVTTSLQQRLPAYSLYKHTERITQRNPNTHSTYNSQGTIRWCTTATSGLQAGSIFSHIRKPDWLSASRLQRPHRAYMSRRLLDGGGGAQFGRRGRFVYFAPHNLTHKQQHSTQIYLYTNLSVMALEKPKAKAKKQILNTCNLLSNPRLVSKR